MLNHQLKIIQNISDSFQKAHYNGREAIEGETREWGGKVFKKEGNKWHLVKNSRKDSWEFGGSRFYPKELPESFKNVLPNKFYDVLEDIPKISFSNVKNEGSEYNPETDRVTVNLKSSSYIAKEVFIHELGHQLHFDKKIITDTKVENAFKKVFDSFKDEFSSLSDEKKAFFKKENVSKAKERLVKLYPNTHGVGNKFGNVADIVQAVTKGEYGFGHTKKYMNEANNSYMEVFAHGHEHYWLGNNLLANFFPKSSKVLISYFKDIFE